MDTTLEYVTMCRGAQEIQDAWEFERGDYFSTIYQAPYGEFCIVNDEWLESHSRHDVPDAWVWLPAKNKLLTMFIDDDVLDNDFHWTLKLMHVDGETHEALWMRCVMYSNYSKVWDGSEWVKA